MSRRAHAIGRGLTCLGLASTGAYLGWRLTTLPGRTPLWLVVVALAVELVGFLGSILLTWALWPSGPTASPSLGPHDARGVDIVVRVDRQPIHQVRATLLAMQSMASGRHVIVDLGARADVIGLSGEFDTVYAAPDIDDHNGLKTCSAAASTPVFLLLDAGDIPSADAISTMLPLLDDDSVAVVIGQSLMSDDDSAEHGPNGMHELSFERQRLHPALGKRGAAIFEESGALIRRAAIDSVEVGDEGPIEAQSMWSLALIGQGWKVAAATGGAVIVRPVLQSQDTVYERRVVQARVARNVLIGPGGILRINSLRPAQRLSLAAAAVRPLSGLRRAGFLAVIVGCLLTGTLPMRPDVTILAALWAPGWILTTVGLGVSSGWTLRPGDRTRTSLRNLGASWQGLRHPMAFEQRRAPIMTPHALQHGGALVASVVLLSSVMMMRGLSEKWTHALGVMPYQWLAGLVAVALWSLAMSLDVLRMIGRRNQLRRAARIVASIPAEVNENPVAVFDITPLGVGFETNQELATKQQLVLEAMITTALGCEDVTLPINVRNVRNVSEERWRVGAEFGDAEPRAINALVEYCMVEPARQRLGWPGRVAPTGVDIAVEPLALPIVDGRRLALRLISLLAIAGAIATAQPGDGTIVAWVVSAVSVLIAAGVLAGSARPRRAPWVVDQSTSSPSPDLAIR